MKNYLLTFLFIFAIAFTSVGQITYLDFEANAEPTSWEWGGNTRVVAVTNPLATGNTSATVGKITHGDQTWAGNGFTFGGTVTWTATDNVYTMDVYSAVAGDVIFKLEGGDADVEVMVNYDTPNAWKTLTFDFADDLVAGKNFQLALFCGNGSTTADDWFIDNITGPAIDFGSGVDVNFIVNDMGGTATAVSVDIALLEETGETLNLTETDNVFTANKALAGYKITTGGGIYEFILDIDGTEEKIDTVTVDGANESQNWVYMLYDEAVEDGTADAISVGTTPPTIDGTVDEVWEYAKFHSLQQRSWYGSATGMYTTFKLMWDSDNLYILTHVVDTSYYLNPSFPEWAWDNDNVEWFFDMNQSLNNPFDGVDDYQIRVVRGGDVWTGSDLVDDDFKAAATFAVSEIGTDSTGYIIEASIPWSALSSGFLPLATVQFNFDIVTSDCVTSSAREYIESFNTAGDSAYYSTKGYGTITLSAETNETGFGTSIKNIMKIENLSVFPNPVMDQLNITATTEISKIEVFDITGRRASVTSNINAKEVSMNVNHLDKNAIYIVRITDINGSISSKRINVL